MQVFPTLLKEIFLVIRVIHVSATCFHSAPSKLEFLKYLCFPMVLS